MPSSEFVGATGDDGRLQGEEITEAQLRFESWLEDGGWQQDAEGDTQAEALISLYLADFPTEEGNEESIREYSLRVGKMKMKALH